MPLVKIELATGKKRETLLKIRDTVMDAVVETLQLLPDDRNIRISEYDPELFRMKAPYEILIEITMFEGRTRETKRKLFRTIADQLENTCDIDRKKLFILINEQPMMNWGVRGCIPADELDLGFKVNI
jgi:4-oxalocrotonate tautomerase family enzyme